MFSSYVFLQDIVECKYFLKKSKIQVKNFQKL